MRSLLSCLLQYVVVVVVAVRGAMRAPLVDVRRQDARRRCFHAVLLPVVSGEGRVDSSSAGQGIPRRRIRATHWERSTTPSGRRPKSLTASSDLAPSRCTSECARSCPACNCCSRRWRESCGIGRRRVCIASRLRYSRPRGPRQLMRRLPLSARSPMPLRETTPRGRGRAARGRA